MNKFDNGFGSFDVFGGYDWGFGRRKDCAENWNLLTNFDRSKRPIYEAAIKLYGKEDVYIDENAYWTNGHKDETMCSLRRTKDGDYSEFWRVFHRVEAKMTTTLFVVEFSEPATEVVPVGFIENETQLEWARKIVDAFNYVNDAEICYIDKYMHDEQEVYAVFFHYGVSDEFKQLYQALHAVLVCNEHTVDSIALLSPYMSTGVFGWGSTYRICRTRDTAMHALLGDPFYWG